MCTDESSQSQGDHTLFFKCLYLIKTMGLILYVDDIIVTCDNKEEIKGLESWLENEFEMKDMGNLRYFLRFEVARSSYGIIVSQRKYILDWLEESRMTGSKSTKTPIDLNHKLGFLQKKFPLKRKRPKASGKTDSPLECHMDAV